MGTLLLTTRQVTKRTLRVAIGTRALHRLMHRPTIVRVDPAEQSTAREAPHGHDVLDTQRQRVGRNGVLRQVGDTGRL